MPWEEASRFGIMACDEDKKIYEFAEKPKEPKSNLASMGIYIFTWSKLKKYLEEDEANPDSENDFGKNVIPAMLQNGERMYAYAFEGYWKDVGTIDSLWEANMDLLDPNVPLDLYDDSWKIYARNPVMPPQYVADGAVTQNAMISEGCYVEGEVDFSILFAGVTVEKGAVVHDSIVMPGSVINGGRGGRVFDRSRGRCGRRERSGWLPSGKHGGQTELGRNGHCQGNPDRQGRQGAGQGND